jgi:hypothetical protein
MACHLACSRKASTGTPQATCGVAVSMWYLVRVHQATPFLGAFEGAHWQSIWAAESFGHPRATCPCCTGSCGRCIPARRRVLACEGRGWWRSLGWAAGLGCAQETHSSVQVEVVYVASSGLHTQAQMISTGAKKAATKQGGSAPRGLQAPCDGRAQAPNDYGAAN